MCSAHSLDARPVLSTQPAMLQQAKPLFWLMLGHEGPLGYLLLLLLLLICSDAQIVQI